MALGVQFLSEESSRTHYFLCGISHCEVVLGVVYQGDIDFTRQFVCYYQVESNLLCHKFHPLLKHELKGSSDVDLHSLVLTLGRD